MARTLYPKRYTASRVVAELRPLLDDPGYPTRAAATAAVVREEGGAEAAAEAIAAVE